MFEVTPQHLDAETEPTEVKNLDLLWKNIPVRFKRDPETKAIIKIVEQTNSHDKDHLHLDDHFVMESDMNEFITAFELAGINRSLISFDPARNEDGEDISGSFTLPLDPVNEALRNGKLAIEENDKGIRFVEFPKY
jgi:hypothetical protein